MQRFCSFRLRTAKGFNEDPTNGMWTVCGTHWRRLAKTSTLQRTLICLFVIWFQGPQDPGLEVHVNVKIRYVLHLLETGTIQRRSELVQLVPLDLATVHRISKRTNTRFLVLCRPCLSFRQGELFIFLNFWNSWILQTLFNLIASLCDALMTLNPFFDPFLHEVLYVAESLT